MMLMLEHIQWIEWESLEVIFIIFSISKKQGVKKKCEIIAITRASSMNKYWK